MGLSRKMQIIMNYLERVDRPAPPREITAETGLNGNTVRRLLGIMIDRGLVWRPYDGFYRILTPYGDEDISPIMVHDLRLVASIVELVKLDKREDVKFQVNNTMVQYQFGKSNGKFSVAISNSNGIEKDELMKILSRVELDSERFFGFIPSFKASFHLNRDIPKKELTVLKSVTIHNWKGFFTRVYNKGSSIRIEHGITDSSVDELVSLVCGDFNIYVVTKKSIEAMKQVHEVVKEVNRKCQINSSKLDRIILLLESGYMEN